MVRGMFPWQKTFVIALVVAVATVAPGQEKTAGIGTGTPAPSGQGQPKSQGAVSPQAQSSPQSPGFTVQEAMRVMNERMRESREAGTQAVRESQAAAERQKKWNQAHPPKVHSWRGDSGDRWPSTPTQTQWADVTGGILGTLTCIGGILLAKGVGHLCRRVNRKFGWTSRPPDEHWTEAFVSLGRIFAGFFGLMTLWWLATMLFKTWFK